MNSSITPLLKTCYSAIYLTYGIASILIPDIYGTVVSVRNISGALGLIERVSVIYNVNKKRSLYIFSICLSAAYPFLKTTATASFIFLKNKLL